MSTAVGKLSSLVFGVIWLLATVAIWILNIYIYFMIYKNTLMLESVTSERCWSALVVPVVLAVWGSVTGNLRISGVIAVVVIGYIVALCSYGLAASLATLLFAGSTAMHWRSHRKLKLDGGVHQATRCSWVYVVCVAGVATELAILHLVEFGCGAEYVIDFNRRYVHSWLTVAAVGSLAAACGDALAAGVGGAVGTGPPRLVTSWKQVPRGTNGAVSLAGTLASCVGGLTVGLAYFVVMTTCCRHDVTAPPQWPVVAIATFCGFYGSLVDSLLGATVQFTGVDLNTGFIVDSPTATPNVKHVSGVALIGNHVVDLITTVFVAFTAPYIAHAVWSIDFITT